MKININRTVISSETIEKRSDFNKVLKHSIAQKNLDNFNSWFLIFSSQKQENFCKNRIQIDAPELKKECIDQSEFCNFIKIPLELFHKC